MNVPGEQETRVEEGELPSEIPRLVADATGTDYRPLPNLFGTVDVDALERLRRSTDGELTVHLVYAGCDVLLGKDDTLVVRERDD